MLSKSLYLEIDKPNYIPIYTVQYDYNSRFYEIAILNNSQPLDLTGIRVIVAGKKPDGKEVFNSCKVLDAKKGLIQLELTEQMNAVNGASEYALELFSADGMLSSQPFKLIVTRSTISKSVESSKELGALKDALNEVQDIDNRFAQTNAQLSQSKKELTNKINEVAEKGTTVEVIEAAIEEEVDKAIHDGRIANLTIEDDSIEGRKLKNGEIRLNKLNEDLQSILFPKKLIKLQINNYNESATNHINESVRFIQKEMILKNTFINTIKVFLGNDPTFVGGTLKLELFEVTDTHLVKYFEREYQGTLGSNVLDVNVLAKENSYVSLSRKGYALLKFTQGESNNCYYTSNTEADELEVATLSLGNFILSMDVEVVDLGLGSYKSGQRNVLIVDKENGDFDNIQDAINSIKDDSEDNPYIIRVGQGVFPRFSMRASVTGVNRMRHISIIGENKYTTVIKDTTGHYVTGSCDVWTKGTIENLTVEVSHENDTSEDHRKSYALHFDFGKCDTEVRNCILISHQAPAVGIGLYQDTTITFKDCELYNLCPSDYGTLVDYGGIFCHSQSAENITNQNIKLNNCKVISKNGNKSAWFSKIGSGGEMVVESINTMYYSHKEGVGSKVENNAKLSPYNYGNNAFNLNN